MSISQYVFVPDPSVLFRPGRITGIDNGSYEVVDLLDQQIKTVVKIDQTFPVASLEEIESPPADLILLSVVHRPLILYTLRHHFLKDAIYTNVGQILVAVNPFKWIPGIYDQNVMLQYVNGTINAVEFPHVFALARDAYEGLQNGENQSLIISGESGAGKTEATKQCLKYLAFAAGSNSGVEEKILQASPILEGWGNAKTLRNDNSSRFGKFIEIWFGPKVDIIGSSNTTYLLEKSRVVFQERDERNYHVFYQLLFGAPPEELQRLHLTQMAANFSSIQYINQSGCVRVPTINDERDYVEAQAAFTSMGFHADEPPILSAIVAGVLHMGNIMFVPNPSAQEEAAIATDTEEHFDRTVLLWGLDVEAARQALLFRKIRTGGSKSDTFVMKAFECATAVENRNALTKEIYNRCFDWIVGTINEKLAGTTQQATMLGTIGVLDIFGFEIFKKNSLEQLCINLANEALQQHFNFNIFQAEMDLYKAEGVTIPELTINDNKDVLDILMLKKTGLIDKLDEEGQVPGGSTEGFLSKFCKLHASNKRLVNKSRTREFAINHYAGEVVYDPTLFLSKNKDTLSVDVVEVLAGSSVPFIAKLFTDTEAVAGGAAESPSKSSSKSSTASNKQTVGKKFTIQLASLMDTLNKTHPHYIRCIKPNPQKKPNIFDSQLTNEQLTYSGVFEAVIIMQSGYPFRYNLQEFRSRYHMLVPGRFKSELYANWGARKSKTIVPATQEQCQALLNRAADCTGHPEIRECNVGRTMILYRSHQNLALESLRRSYMARAVVTAQRILRGALTRKIVTAVQTYTRTCAAAISACNVRDMRTESTALTNACLKLLKVTKIDVVQPEVKVAEDFSSALLFEKEYEGQLTTLISDTSKQHVIKSTGNMRSLMTDIKANVAFSAVLHGKTISRIWSENEIFARAETKICRYEKTISVMNSLKENVAAKNELDLELLLADIDRLRVSEELVSGYCSDDEVLAVKITSDARHAFTEFLESIKSSLFNGSLVCTRNAVTSELSFAVDSASVTEMVTAVYADTSRRMTQKVLTFMELATFVRDIRVAVEKSDWKKVFSLVQSMDISDFGSAFQLDKHSKGEKKKLHAALDVREKIAEELRQVFLGVIDFIVIPNVEAQMSVVRIPPELTLSPVHVDLTAFSAALASLSNFAPFFDDCHSRFNKALLEKLAIRRALELVSVSDIERAIHSATHVASTDPDIANAKKYLALHSTRAALERALREDGPRGEIGTLNFSEIVLENMESGLQQSKAVTVFGVEWSVIVSTCSCVQRLRALLFQDLKTQALEYIDTVELDTSFLLAKSGSSTGAAAATAQESQDSHESHSMSAKALVASVVSLAQSEINLCRRELIHIRAIGMVISAINDGAVKGDVGLMDIQTVSVAELGAVVATVDEDLIKTPDVVRLLNDITIITSLRKAVLAADWRSIEMQISDLFESTGKFQLCHPAVIKELFILRGEVLDKKIRERLAAVINEPLPEPTEEGRIYFTAENLSNLASVISFVEAQDFKSYESLFMLQCAVAIYHLKEALNADRWEPASVCSHGLTTSTLPEVLTLNASEGDDQIHRITNMSLFTTSVSTADMRQLGACSVKSWTVADILQYFVFNGVYPSACPFIDAVRAIAFQRRCKCVLLLAANEGQVLGSVHAGLGPATVNVKLLVRALKYVHLNSMHHCAVICNWVTATQALLSIRLAVLSCVSAAGSRGAESPGIAGSGGSAGIGGGVSDQSASGVELSQYVFAEETYATVTSTLPGYPTQEMTLVADYVTDVSSVQALLQELTQGRPQYFMGQLTASGVEYETLTSQLLLAKHIRNRSDRLDRLMFYADLCIKSRRAVVLHHWDYAQMGGRPRDPDSIDIKGCVEEFVRANKFFSEKLEGIPPQCLLDDFKLYQREFERRAIMEQFAIVLKSGAVSGTPFALTLDRIDSEALSKQLSRVRAWETLTGVRDVEMMTLTKACEEIMRLRTCVFTIHSTFKRGAILAEAKSVDVKDIISLGFLDEAVNMALLNTSKLCAAPYPIVEEWAPMEKEIMAVDAASRVRTARNELDLLSAETFTRQFITNTIDLFKSVVDGCLTAEAAKAVMTELHKSCQSYENRMKERESNRQVKASAARPSPALELVYSSAVVLLHVLRAEYLGTYDEPDRNWRSDPGLTRTPRLLALIQSIDLGRYSMQQLLRCVASLDLHPCVLSQIKRLVCIVEDKVSHAELLAGLAVGYADGAVGQLNYAQLSAEALNFALERIGRIGLFDEDLKALCSSCQLIARLRTRLREEDHAKGAAEAIELLQCSPSHPAKQDFSSLLQTVYSGSFLYHPKARDELLLLLFEICDGYWMHMAFRALNTGGGRGSRGAISSSSLSWAKIDEVLGLARGLKDKSPQLRELMSICESIRFVRRQLAGSGGDIWGKVGPIEGTLTTVVKSWPEHDKGDNDNDADADASNTATATTTGSEQRAEYAAVASFVECCMDYALATVEHITVTNQHHLPPANAQECLTKIAQIQRRLENMTDTSILDTLTKKSLISECELCVDHVNYICAVSGLYKASALQPVWYGDYGLEVTDLCLIVLRTPISTACRQNWASSCDDFPSEHWWKRILDIWVAVVEFCDVIKAISDHTIEPGSSEFHRIRAPLQSILQLFDRFVQDGQCTRGFLKRQRLPGCLEQIEGHLRACLAEDERIQEISAILRSDAVQCRSDEDGRLVIEIVPCNSDLSPKPTRSLRVRGSVNHHRDDSGNGGDDIDAANEVSGTVPPSDDYPRHGQEVITYLKSLPMTSVRGSLFQKTSVMYIELRIAIATASWNEAYGISEVLAGMDNSCCSDMVDPDPDTMAKYFEFLSTKRELEEALTCCILPPLAGWSSFGSMPLFALSIVDIPLASALAKLKIDSSRLVTVAAHPEIRELMEVGELMLQLVAAIRSKSWTKLVPVSATVTESSEGQESVRTSALHPVESDSNVKSPQLPQNIGIDSNSIDILTAVAKQCPAVEGLRSAVLEYYGATVVDIAKHQLPDWLGSSKCLCPEVKAFVEQILAMISIELRCTELEEAVADTLRTCQTQGTPGELVVPANTVTMLQSLCLRFETDQDLIARCYNLKRAYQTSKVVFAIHHALSQENLGDLGKYLCMLSFMANRKRSVMEQKCEEFLYRTHRDVHTILSLGSESFQGSIQQLTEQLSQAASESVNELVEELPREVLDSRDFLEEIAESTMQCPLEHVLRLRDEFYDDMVVLEQHYIFECHYNDFKMALASRPADGIPGELNIDYIVYDSLAEMMHSLTLHGLVSEGSAGVITLPSLLLGAIESLYLLRRGQHSHNVDMIRHALQLADVARKNESQHLALRRDLSKEGKVRRGSVSNEGGRRFILMASDELDKARKDLEQRDIVAILSNAIASNRLHPTLGSAIDIEPLAAAVVQCEETVPTCTIAKELSKTGTILLTIRRFAYQQEWNELYLFIQDLDRRSVLKSSLREIDAARRLAIVSEAEKRARRCYDDGQITSDSNAQLAADALEFFDKIDESWKTADIVMHHNSCTCLHLIRRHFAIEDWHVVYDIAVVYLDKERLDSNPLTPHVEDEIMIAKQVAAYKLCMETFLQAFSVGKMVGEVGAVDVSQVAAITMKTALDVCAHARSDHADVEALNISAEIIHDLRLAQLRGAWVDHDPDNPDDWWCSLSVEGAIDVVAGLAELPRSQLPSTIVNDVDFYRTYRLKMKRKAKRSPVIGAVNLDPDLCVCRESATEAVRPTRTATRHRSDTFYQKSAKEQWADLISIFRRLDTNGDGVISREEFYAGTALLGDGATGEGGGGGGGGGGLTKEQADDMFESIDIDGSGEISLDEMIQVWTSTEGHVFEEAAPEESTVFQAFSVKQIITLVQEQNVALAPMAIDEVTFASQELAYREICFALLKALRSPGITGTPGNIDLSHVDVESLETAVALASQWSAVVGRAHGQWLNRDAELLLRLRKLRLAEAWAELRALFSEAEEQNSLAHQSAQRFVFHLQSQSTSGDDEESSVVVAAAAVSPAREDSSKELGSQISPADIATTTVSQSPPSQPILAPVWDELQRVKGDTMFRMLLAQFAQEMQADDFFDKAVKGRLSHAHNHESGSDSGSGSGTDTHLNSLLQTYAVAKQAAILHPSDDFNRLIEAIGMGLELQIFQKYESEKSPTDIIQKVAEVIRRDQAAGLTCYMTFLTAAISRMSNVVDKKMHVDRLQNEIKKGQIYLQRPLGCIDPQVADVTELRSTLAAAMPLVSVLGSPGDLRLLALAEAAIAVREAVATGDWQHIHATLQSHQVTLHVPVMLEEVDRLMCEYENYKTCVMLKDEALKGRYINVVALAKLIHRPRPSSSLHVEHRRLSQLPLHFLAGLESLKNAIDAANELPVRSEGTDNTIRAAIVIFRLREKMANGLWDDVKTLVTDEAKYANMPQFAAEELQAVKAAGSYRATMSLVCDALLQGAVTGQPGEVSLSAVDFYALQQALNTSKDLDMTDTATAVMYYVGISMLRLRKAVKNGLWFQVQKNRSGVRRLSQTDGGGDDDGDSEDSEEWEEDTAHNEAGGSDSADELDPVGAVASGISSIESELSAAALRLVATTEEKEQGEEDDDVESLITKTPFAGVQTRATDPHMLKSVVHASNECKESDVDDEEAVAPLLLDSLLHDACGTVGELSDALTTERSGKGGDEISGASLPVDVESSSKAASPRARRTSIFLSALHTAISASTPGEGDPTDSLSDTLDPSSEPHAGDAKSGALSGVSSSLKSPAVKPKKLRFAEEIEEEDEKAHAVTSSSSPLMSPASPNGSPKNKLQRQRRRSVMRRKGEKLREQLVTQSADSVEELVEEFMAKKDENYSRFRDALELGTDDSFRGAADWTVHQWEAMTNVAAEVDLIRAELVEKKIRAQIIAALEAVPKIVQSYHGGKQMKVLLDSQLTALNPALAVPGSTAAVGAFASGVGVNLGTSADDVAWLTSYKAMEANDPMRIIPLEKALSGMEILAGSAGVSTDTAQLVFTAQLLLRFRQCLHAADMDAFRELLKEAMEQQTQGILSMHYGVLELAAYKSASLAVSVARTNLIAALREGTIRGSLDAIPWHSVDTSNLTVWIDACKNLTSRAKDVSLGLADILQEAEVVLRLRQAVRGQQWGMLDSLIREFHAFPTVVSISADEIKHLTYLSKFLECKNHLEMVLHETAEVDFENNYTSLLFRIPVLEDLLLTMKDVLAYDSELLPLEDTSSQHRALLHDPKRVHSMVHVGEELLNLWKAIGMQNWNVEPLAAGNLYLFEVPHDPILGKYFHGIRAYETAHRLDGVHAQLQLGAAALLGKGGAKARMLASSSKGAERSRERNRERNLDGDLGEDDGRGRGANLRSTAFRERSKSPSRYQLTADRQLQFASPVQVPSVTPLAAPTAETTVDQLALEMLRKPTMAASSYFGSSSSGPPASPSVEIATGSPRVGRGGGKTVGAKSRRMSLIRHSPDDDLSLVSGVSSPQARLFSSSSAAAAAAADALAGMGPPYSTTRVLSAQSTYSSPSAPPTRRRSVAMVAEQVTLAETALVVGAGGPAGGRSGMNRRQSISRVADQYNSVTNQKKKSAGAKKVRRYSMDTVQYIGTDVQGGHAHAETTYWKDDIEARNGSVSALLCRIDWSDFPENIRRFFTLARNSLLDQCIRRRLMFGCADGVTAMDEAGNLELEEGSTDVLEVVIRDARRVQRHSEKTDGELNCLLKYSTVTISWLSAAKSLLVCRRSLLHGDMDGFIAELTGQGYLGKFRKLNFIDRPGKEEFDLLERFGFEYLAEATLQSGLSFLAAQTSITAEVSQHEQLVALKQLDVHPQAMSSPTAFYTQLIDIVRMVKHVIDSTVQGDWARMMMLQDQLSKVVAETSFHRDDIADNLRAGVAVLKASMPSDVVILPAQKSIDILRHTSHSATPASASTTVGGGGARTGALSPLLNLTATTAIPTKSSSSVSPLFGASKIPSQTKPSGLQLQSQPLKEQHQPPPPPSPQPLARHKLAALFGSDDDFPEEDTHAASSPPPPPPPPPPLPPSLATAVAAAKLPQQPTVAAGSRDAPLSPSKSPSHSPSKRQVTAARWDYDLSSINLNPVNSTIPYEDVAGLAMTAATEHSDLCFTVLERSSAASVVVEATVRRLADIFAILCHSVAEKNSARRRYLAGGDDSATAPVGFDDGDNDVVDNIEDDVFGGAVASPVRARGRGLPAGFGSPGHRSLMKSKRPAARERNTDFLSSRTAGAGGVGRSGSKTLQAVKLLAHTGIAPVRDSAISPVHSVPSHVFHDLQAIVPSFSEVFLLSHPMWAIAAKTVLCLVEELRAVRLKDQQRSEVRRALLRRNNTVRKLVPLNVDGDWTYGFDFVEPVSTSTPVEGEAIELPDLVSDFAIKLLATYKCSVTTHDKLRDHFTRSGPNILTVTYLLQALIQARRLPPASVGVADEFSDPDATGNDDSVGSVLSPSALIPRTPLPSPLMRTPKAKQAAAFTATPTHTLTPISRTAAPAVTGVDSCEEADEYPSSQPYSSPKEVLVVIKSYVNLIQSVASACCGASSRLTQKEDCTDREIEASTTAGAGARIRINANSLARLSSDFSSSTDPRKSSDGSGSATHSDYARPNTGTGRFRLTKVPEGDEEGVDEGDGVEAGGTDEVREGEALMESARREAQASGAVRMGVAARAMSQCAALARLFR